MNQVKKLFLRVDPLCSDRQHRNDNVAAIVEDYNKFCASLHMLPNPPDATRTAETFERNWRSNIFFEQYFNLAVFALKLSRSGISEAACERVFSKLKYIINPLRSRTAIKNVRDQLNINMINGLALNRELNLKDNGFFTSAVITNEFVDFAIKIWMSAVNTGKFKLPDEAAPQQAAPAAVQEDAEVQEIDNQEVQVGVRCETCRQVKQDCRECPGVGNQRCPNKIKQCEACRNSNGYDFCFACALKNQN